MRILRSKMFLVLLASAIAAGIVAGVAVPALISKQIIADGYNLHYQFAKSTADGFDSSWHVHPGLAIVQVQEGSIQIYQGSCTPKTVKAGDTYIEVPWEPVRAIATGRVVWTTSLLISGPDALSIPLETYAPGAPTPCPGIG